MAATGGAGTGSTIVTPVVSPATTPASSRRGSGFVASTVAPVRVSSIVQVLIRQELERKNINRKGLGIVGDNVVSPTNSTALDPKKYSIDDTIEEIDMEGIHGRSVYHIRSKDNGAILRVRKMEYRTSGREGQYTATVKEAVVYDTLVKSTTDYENHLFPFIEAVNDDIAGIVLIDFAYLEGDTFDIHLKTNPTAKKTLLIEAAKHLQWLLANGYTHGDVKMDNFFITTAGETRIFDFGTANSLFNERGIEEDVRRLLVMGGLESVIPIDRLTGIAKSSRGNIQRLHSNLTSAQKVALKESNRRAYINYGIRMYDEIIRILQTAPPTGGGGAASGGASTTQGGGRHRKTRRRNRNKRRTHKSMPRIMR